MMKRKMTKKGLVGNGLLFLIALVSVAATHEIGIMSKPVTSDTTQLSFDTLLLKLNGASETDMLTAPAISLNKQAVQYVNSYMAENSELLEEIRDKSGMYFKIADDIFSKYDLPQELKYLAVVESELKMTAFSKVGARGPWQLMPETARLLSLKVTKKYDERTHYYKSTIAAARYLKDLHAIFGDWLLVIAAYNSGPGRVFEAIKKSGSRNFWKLQNFLPAETRGHVKKFVATHYYFEGKGSVTTLTQAEVISYRKIMTEFVIKHNSLLNEKQTGAEIAVETPVNKGEIAKAKSNSSTVVE
jgi:membrane-bound lytic murein transglycosylase D